MFVFFSVIGVGFIVCFRDVYELVGCSVGRRGDGLWVGNGMNFGVVMVIGCGCCFF